VPWHLDLLTSSTRTEASWYVRWTTSAWHRPEATVRLHPLDRLT